MKDDGAFPGSKRLLLIRTGFICSVLAIAALGLALVRPAALSGPEPGYPGSFHLKWGLLAASVLIFPLLRRWAHGLDEAYRASPARVNDAARAPGTRERGYLVIFGCAALPALFGLLLFFLGHPARIFLLTCGLSLFYLAALGPLTESGEVPRAPGA